MIRKTVVTCSLITIAFILTKMFGYNYSIGFDKANIPDSTKIELTLKHAKKEVLSFANEFIPVGDKRVTFKMKKALKANSYANLQTHRLHQRAGKWFPIIEPILKQYGIPEDFKYIPLVESGLAPRGSQSSKGAAGLWQFMPQTARDYGLVVNGDTDERMQVKKATIAAAKYIKDLHRQFGNWILVAAAYNVGEGTLRRQIRAQKQSNYFKLKLNRETGKYVYSLISMKEVIENPATYGYKINNPRRLLAYQP